MPNAWNEHLKLLPPPIQAVPPVEGVTLHQRAGVIHLIDKATSRRLAAMTASPVALRDARVLVDGMNQQCFYQQQIIKLEREIARLEDILAGRLPGQVVRK